jgi:hypothetical protein
VHTFIPAEDDDAKEFFRGDCTYSLLSHAVYLVRGRFTVAGMPLACGDMEAPVRMAVRRVNTLRARTKRKIIRRPQRSLAVSSSVLRNDGQLQAKSAATLGLLSGSLPSPRIHLTGALACGCGHPALSDIKSTSI